MTIVRKYIDELPDDQATHIPKELFLDTRLSDGAKTVFGYSASLSAKGEDATITAIAIGLKMSRNRAIRLVKELDDTGWVSEVDYAS